MLAFDTCVLRSSLDALSRGVLERRGYPRDAAL